mgnify:CR=1 FL=1
MITHRTYILASSSSSRYNILKRAGLKFRKTKPLCNEEEIKNKISKTNKPSFVAKKLSFEKAKSVSKTKKHKNDYVSVYAHNRRNLVDEGQKVRQGFQIAELGNSGRSTGPHLHFEIRYKGKPLDPLRLIGKKP